MYDVIGCGGALHVSTAVAQAVSASYDARLCLIDIATLPLLRRLSEQAVKLVYNCAVVGCEDGLFDLAQFRRCSLFVSIAIGCIPSIRGHHVHGLFPSSEGPFWLLASDRSRVVIGMTGAYLQMAAFRYQPRHLSYC